MSAMKDMLMVTAYSLYSVAYPDYVLDLRGSNPANRTDCIIYPHNPGAANQEWLIKLP